MNLFQSSVLNLTKRNIIKIEVYEKFYVTVFILYPCVNTDKNHTGHALSAGNLMKLVCNMIQLRSETQTVIESNFSALK